MSNISNNNLPRLNRCRYVEGMFRSLIGHVSSLDRNFITTQFQRLGALWQRMAPGPRNRAAAYTMIVLPRGRCELLEEGQGHVADSGRTGPHEFPRLDHTSENVEEKHLDDNRETEESGFYDLDAYVEKLRCEKEKFGFDWDTYLKTFLNGNSEWPAEFDRICEAATLSTPEEVGNFARTKMSASGIKSFRQNGRIESLKAKDFARMDPEEKQFTTSFTKICAIKRHLNAFDAFFKTLGPGCTLEMLRPEKRLKLDAEIERFVTRSAELRDQAFYRKNGCSIQTASGLLPTNHKMQFFPEDFNVSSFLHGKSGVEMNIASLCGSRESKLKVFKRVNRSFNIYDKLKLYLAAANKLKKGIDDLTEEEFTVIEGKLREEQTRMATKKADQAYQELMRREEAHQKSARAQVHAQVNAPGKSHKKKNDCNDCVVAPKAPSKTKRQPNAATDPMRRIILGLCESNYPSKYTLDPRVTRWSANDLEAIRGFGDKYQDLSPQQRKHQRAAHYLSGIERIISEPELVKNYTFKTTYKESSGKTRRGLGLYARMVDSGGNSDSGIVRLGIDSDRVIYHAMFEQVGGNTCSLADVKKQSETDSPANGPWENISESSFNLVTDEGVERVISLENGKKEKDRVTFLFYPLV